MISTAVDDGAHRRLEQLYEITKLFVSFDVVERTFDEALRLIAAKLPLASAILIEATIGGRTDMMVWPCADSAPAAMVAAKTHATAAYAYLVGAVSFGALEVHEDVRESLGPTLLPARGGGDRAGDPRRFIVIPLVVGGGVVFGALQFEGAARLDRGDLAFINAIANQLAIALERNRGRRYDVLRRKEAQRLQAKYEALVDHLDSAFVWEANAETRRILYVSGQFERMLGFRRQWCLDEPDWWSAHVHPDDRAQLRDTFERALAEPGNKRCEHRCVASDGSIRWLRTSIHLVGAGGEPPVFQGVSFDVTAAHAIQEQVREQLSFMSTMAGTLAEGTVAIDLADRITFINDAGLSLLGCDGRDALGKRSAVIAHVETAAGVVVDSPLATAIELGRVGSDSHVIVRADGKRFPASYVATPIRRDGKVTGAVLTFDDITERRQAQEADHFLLQASAALSASLDSVAVANATARIGIPRLGQMCFVDVVSLEDELRPVAWAHADPELQDVFTRPIDAPRREPVFAIPLGEVMATGRSMRVPVVPEAWFSVPDLEAVRRLGLRSALIVPLTLGTRRIGALTFGMTDARGLGDAEVALAEELARRSGLAIEHARLYERARQAVALREQTLAIVSHDLRSPLATIVMAASMLGDDGLTAASARSTVLAADKIRTAADRMDRMIEDLMDFASIEAGQLSILPRPHEVAGILKESVASFEAMASKHHVNLVGGADPDVPAIQCDRDRILQIITNLVSNALKCVKSGDSIALRAKLGSREVVFSVADTGPGIPLTDQARLFERYWRSPNAGYKGTGLGLAIARGLVEAHHGRLWVESEPGNGATFCFTMPLAEPPPGSRGQVRSEQDAS